MKNKGMYIELLSLEESEGTRCADCTSYAECHYLRECFDMKEKSGVRDVDMSHAVMVVQNLLSEPIYLSCDDFHAIDKDGFSCVGYGVCNNCMKERRSETSGCYVLPKTKVRFMLMFPMRNITKIIYSKEFYDDCCFVLNVEEKERTDAVGVIMAEMAGKDKMINDLKEKIEELEEENLRLMQSARESSGGWKGAIKRADEDLMCKYEVVEDDDYYRIISLEKEDTVSFNREFDKSKDNYNWINKGDALISLRADNAFGFRMDGRTIIKSPIAGIFESDNNKMIGYKQEICRIRKYPQSQKEEIISGLEKQAIKEAVYKKERKKMIEREALDELIEEGKVFNVYTKKDGNRTTIPMDVATAVWNRDGGKCCICGGRENLEFDHIIPISKGGATTFRNLQILCHNCNLQKSDTI